MHVVSGSLPSVVLMYVGFQIESGWVEMYAQACRELLSKKDHHMYVIDKRNTAI